MKPEDKKAVKTDPGHTLSHNNLAILYFCKKQYDLTVRHCDRAIELGHKVDPRFLKDLEPHRK
jgi:Tfp pilus assembly protein PilF